MLIILNLFDKTENRRNLADKRERKEIGTKIEALEYLWVTRKIIS